MIRSTASITLSRLPKADSRKYPSPLGPKPRAGGADHVAFVQELVEEFPGGQSRRGLEPDVGGVDAAVDGEPASVSPSRMMRAFSM